MVKCKLPEVDKGIGESNKEDKKRWRRRDSDEVEKLMPVEMAMEVDELWTDVEGGDQAPRTPEREESEAEGPEDGEATPRAESLSQDEPNAHEGEEQGVESSPQQEAEGEEGREDEGEEGRGVESTRTGLKVSREEKEKTQTHPLPIPELVQVLRDGKIA